MKLFSDLQAFLYELYEDFSAHNVKGQEKIEKSFYYLYTKKKKSEQAAAIAETKQQLEEYANRAKPNKFVLLHAAYLAFKFGKLSAEEYEKYFLDLSDSKARSAKFLEADIKNASDAAPYNDALEEYLLKNIVRDFFDNAGFRKLNDSIERHYDSDAQNTDNSNAKSKYRRHSKSVEKNTDNIDMLYEYLYNYKNAQLSDEAPTTTAADMSEEFKYECSELYKALMTDPDSSVFMPLYFDSKSGAGIFIIGREQFDESLYEKVTENCAVCILHFMDVSLNAQPGDGFIAMDLSMWVEICDDVMSAFEAFERGVRSDAYFIEYSEMNMVDEDAFSDKETAKRFEPRMSLRRSKIAEQKAKEQQELARIKAEEKEFFKQQKQSPKGS